MKFQGILALAVFTLVAFAITRVKSITIDNQLVIIANDCYTRIAIGSTLPAKDVFGNAKAATVTECEDECSRKRNSCETFSFGIGPKGNASCVLGSRIPDGDELLPDSDYDIYIRQQSSPNCMPDRIYKLGSGKRNPTDFNPLASRYPMKNPNDAYNVNNDRDKEDPVVVGAKPHSPGSIIPGPGGFGTVTIDRPNPDVNDPREKAPGSNGFQILTLDPNAEKNHHNNYGSRDHQPGYQVTEVTPHLGYPGPAPFDEDNPNGPYTYANKIPYGVQNGQSQSGYGSPSNFGNSGPGKHKDFGPVPNHFYGVGDNYFYEGDGNPAGPGDRDYYVYTLETGNRYGINVYEEAPSRGSAMCEDNFSPFPSRAIAGVTRTALETNNGNGNDTDSKLFENLHRVALHGCTFPALCCIYVYA